MKRMLLLSAFWFFAVHISYAQDRTIEGNVTDATDNLPLIGANVVVKDTKIGTTTDENGHFVLGLPPNATTLVISFIGKKAQEVAIPASGNITVALVDDAKVVGDVVVTALGIKREQKSLGYATQTLDGSNVSIAKEANVINSLQGKIAGVQITGSSNLGGSSRILIRGAKSIDGQNQPLFVVDGVPIDNSNFATADQARGALGYDYGNAAQDINSDDIETMNILRGPAATALYGNRGANGVIVITTKKGTQRKDGKGKSPIGVTVSQNVAFNQVAVLPKYQNLYGGGTIDTFRNSVVFPGSKRAQYNYDGSWGPKMEGQMVLPWYAFYEYDTANYGKSVPWSPEPNNVKSFFRTGVLSNTNVSLDGANDKGGFRLSFSNLYQSGTSPNSNINRSTVGFNGSYNFGSHVTSGINVNYVRGIGKGRPQTGYENTASNFNQWFQRQLNMDQLRNYKNPDGTQRSWNRGSETNPNPLYWDNLFWTAYENYQTDQRDRVYGNVFVGYKFTDWLSAKGTVMTDFYEDARQERVAVGSVKVSKFRENVITHTENNYELMLNAHHIFKEKFDISGFIGINRRDEKRIDNLSETQGGLNVPNFYSLENSVDKVFVDNVIRKKVVNSFFASASFGYAGMLFIDVTARNDWSSTLPLKNASYFYPSASASFIYTELFKSNWFNYGKIRGGWAKVGNDTDPYRLETRATPTSSFGSDAAYVMPTTINNPNLKPESVYSWEIGTEMRLFKSRLNWDLTYYNSVTKDNIIAIAQSPTTGYDYRVANAGTIANSGVEFTSSIVPVRTKSGFEWSIGFNIAKNWNKVKELYKDEAGNEVTSFQLQNAPFAVTLEARVGEAYGQIIGTDYERDANGNKLVDPVSGAYVPTPDVRPLGSVLADFTGGISTTLSYKGFSLFALFDFQKGGNLFSLTNTWGKYSGIFEATAADGIRETGIVNEGLNFTGYDDNGVATTDGTQNTTNIAAVDHFFLDGGYVIAAADVYDASFVKFRELRIQYNFPTKWFEKCFLRGVTVGVTGRNLAILKKNVPNIDPESGLSTKNVQGLEGGQLPTERSIGFNVAFKF